MWSSKAWHKILNWLRKVRMNRRAKRTWRNTVHYVKPELEGLTERIVPSNVACTFLGTVNSDYGLAANWGPAGMPDNTGSDTATIASGATCVLDQTEEVKIAGLTVSSGASLTTKSLITVAPGGSIGTGATTVASTGLLDVATPDINGNTSTLETSTLTTAATAPTTPNLTIDPSAEVEIGVSALLGGDTTITGLLDAKNQGAFNGAVILLGGPGLVSGTGQLEAGINAGITFGPASTWTIGLGNPVGSALKEGKFFVDGPLAFTTNFTNSDADITLNNDGSTTFGSLGGSGSIDWWNGEFDWNGGTIGVAGGFILDGNCDFKVQGANAKYLSTTMTNTGAGIADFDGAGTLWLMTGGKLFNQATPIVPMEMSLPLVAGFATGGNPPGVLDNAGTIEINGSGSGVNISAPLVNEDVLDFASSSGQFANVGPQGWTATCDPTDVKLVSP